MPLFKKWSDFRKYNVLGEPDSFGIYELADSNGNILYIGQGRIRSRLNTHFLIGNSPIPKVAKYRYEITGVKERAEQRERSEIRAFHRTNEGCPPFNRRLG